MFTLCTMTTTGIELQNLQLQTYSIAFEMVLQKVAAGTSLTQALHDYHTPIDPALFRAWIYKDDSRKKAWMVAKALSAEAMEEDILRIADGIDPDGNPSPNDINRAQLQITTRKWLMQVNNKKRYGDTKFVETTQTIKSEYSEMTTDELKLLVLGEDYAS